MKISKVRIVSLLLALSFILGALAVVSFAEGGSAVEGKTLVAKKHTSFGEPTADEPGTLSLCLGATDVGTNQYGVIGEDYDPYYVFKYDPEAIDQPANLEELTVSLGFDPVSVADNSYITLDLELSGETVITKGFFIDLLTRDGAGAEAAGTRLYVNSVAGTLFIDGDAGVADGDSVDLGISAPYVWRHLTLVYDLEWDMTYVYVNGEYYLTLDSALPTDAAAVTAARVGFGAGQATVADALALDNLEVNAYSKESDVDFFDYLGDRDYTLADTNDPFYSDYSAPRHSLAPIAEVTDKDGVTTLYYTAYDLGASVKGGDTVTFLRDVLHPVVFVGEDVATVPASTSKKVTVDKNDKYLVYIYFDPGSVASLVKTKYSRSTTGYVSSSDVKGLAASEVRTVLSADNNPLVTYQVEFYSDWTFDNQYGGIMNTKDSFVTYNLHGYSLNQYRYWEDGGRTYGMNLNGYKDCMYLTVVFNDGFLRLHNIFGNYCTAYFNNIDFQSYENPTTGAKSYTYFELSNQTFYAKHSTYRTWVRNVATTSDDGATGIVHYNFCDVTVTERIGAGNGFVTNQLKNDGVNYSAYVTLKNSYLDATKQNSVFFTQTNGGASHTAGVTDYHHVIENSEIVYSGALVRSYMGTTTVDIKDSKLNGNGASIIYSDPAQSYDTYATVNVYAGTLFTKTDKPIDGKNTAAAMCYFDVSGNPFESAYLAEVNYGTAPYSYSPVRLDINTYYSLTLNSDFGMNIYLPSDMQITAVTYGGEVTEVASLETQTIGEKSYYRFPVSGISPDKLGEKVTVILTSSMFGTLERSYSPISYAEKLLADSDYASVHQLVIDAFAYAYEATKYSTGAESPELASLLDGKTPTAFKVREDEPVCDLDGLPTYIGSAYLDLSGKPTFIFTACNTSFARFTFSYTDKSGNVVSFASNLKSDVTAMQTAKLVIEPDCLLQTITISSANKASGTYSFYTYLLAMEGDNCEPMLKALYTFIQTAKQYKDATYPAYDD